MRWSARRRSLAVCGGADEVRLWDLDSELLAARIATGVDSGATALWRGGAVLWCGFGDGGARAWDERAPRRPCAALADHAAPVLAAAHRADLHALVTACAEGHVRVYDTRTMRLAAAARAPGPLAAAAVHPLANLVACGSVNQCISLFDLKGTPLNTIKFHEGFMGARIGPISCLTFHPLRCAMGVGAKDSTVSVYVSEPRR